MIFVKMQFKMNKKELKIIQSPLNKEDWINDYYVSFIIDMFKLLKQILAYRLQSNHNIHLNQ